jgi:hypothetical protein
LKPSSEFWKSFVEVEDCFNSALRVNHQKCGRRTQACGAKLILHPFRGLNLSSEGTRIWKSSVEVEDRLNFSFESDLEVGKKEKFEF